VNAIELDRVSRSFVTPDGGTYQAIEEISLAVPAGAFVAIVGPSGCGKSTLLNIIAGLLTASSGSVRIEGAPLNGINRRATYMFQRDALLPWKTVRENVALGLTLADVAAADARERADTWLARVGLAPFASHYPSQLSGGMRKRVALAQNWILDRGILLMDEPFSALDVHTRQQMWSLIRGRESISLRPAPRIDDREPEIAGRGPRSTQNLPTLEPVLTAKRASDSTTLTDTGVEKTPDPRTVTRTVILVTHDLEEAITLADDVVVLSAGPASRIVARQDVRLGPSRDLMELRAMPAFLDLHRALWGILREEVIKSQRTMERADA
jgi:NitT/TauT family transport system ATP-binding protein